MKKNNFSIIIINYKSTIKTISFIKKIPRKYQIIIVDNSNDGEIKKKVKFNLKKIKFLMVKNNGYGSAINEGRKLVKTDFFFAFSPDIKGVNKNFFDKFENIINSKLKFGALGPRFLKVEEKSHKQSDPNYKIGLINAISGAAILINTKAFDFVGGFDEKIFLYFEENDFCHRLSKKFKIYQINTAKVYHPKGVKKGVIDVKQEDEDNLKNFYGWHFMWSKFYFFKKNKLFGFSYIYFFPILIRLMLRILLNIILNNKQNKKKYLSRLSGLLSSMFGINSYKRINL